MFIGVEDSRTLDGNVVTITAGGSVRTLTGVPSTAANGATITPTATASSGLPATITVRGACSITAGM